MMSVALLLLLVIFVTRFVLTREGPGSSIPASDGRLEAEVALLREEMERLGAEVRRLEEEQSFLLRLSEGGGKPARKVPERVAPPVEEQAE